MTDAATSETDATDPIAAVAELVLEHLNRAHPDSLLLLAQVLGDRGDATSARATGVDRLGIDVAIEGPGGLTSLRADFAEPVDDVLGVRVQAVALVARAREQAGITEPTSAERAVLAFQAIRTFVTSVVRTEQVTPHFKQITVGGGDLTSFEPLGPDTFLYVLAPPRGRTELTIDQAFTWEAYAQMPVEEQPVGAYYTLRRWRPAAAELDLLFLLHGDEGEGSAWAGRAQPGDPVALWGPRTAWEPPAETSRYLLVADETGLPAVSVILEGLPAGTPVTAFVEVGDPADQLPIETEADLTLTWLPRDGAEAGTTTALVDAVRASAVEVEGTYAWGGGESRAVTAVRRHLRQELGFRREAVSMTGYWRHPTSPAVDADD